MSNNFHSDVLVNGQLIVGSSPGSTAQVGLGAGPTLAAGGAYFAAPFVIGDKFANTLSLADVRIARKSLQASPNATPNVSILSINNLPGTPALPTDIVIGLGAPCGITINTGTDAGLLTIISGTNVKTHSVAGESSINLLKDDLAAFAKKIAAKLESGFETRLSAIASLGAKLESGPTANKAITKSAFQGPINVQGWKGFDIKHPNKPNHRLRHICVEGPESAIYIRGRLKNENIINIPDYWDGLVDPDSITVSLTQIGSSQDLLVDRIDWGKKVVVKSGTASNIDCYYQIWGNRIGPKLFVEYDGESPADYPGDQSGHSIAGYNYDVR
tara:strand:+ start:129 stop:1115 length:987 start_codon:yes stop_codon:yes gene_type:complete